jgi:hypothetical protein
MYNFDTVVEEGEIEENIVADNYNEIIPKKIDDLSHIYYLVNKTVKHGLDDANQDRIKLPKIYNESLENKGFILNQK